MLLGCPWLCSGGSLPAPPVKKWRHSRKTCCCFGFVPCILCTSVKSVNQCHVSYFHFMKFMLMHMSWGMGLEYDTLILQNMWSAFPLILIAIVPSAIGLFKMYRFASIARLKFYKRLSGDYNKKILKLQILPWENFFRFLGVDRGLLGFFFFLQQLNNWSLYQINQFHQLEICFKQCLCKWPACYFQSLALDVTGRQHMLKTVTLKTGKMTVNLRWGNAEGKIW